MRSEEAFPTMDAMLLCAAAIPRSRWTRPTFIGIIRSCLADRRERDRYGRVQYHAEDYSGRSVILAGPSPVIGGPLLPSFSEPFAVPTGHLLGGSSATLCVSHKASGAFVDRWIGYPRRRQVPFQGIGSASQPNRTSLLYSDSDRRGVAICGFACCQGDRALESNKEHDTGYSQAAPVELNRGHSWLVGLLDAYHEISPHRS